MAQFEDVDAVILDTGSLFTKAGFGGDDQPRVTLRSVVGYGWSRHPRIREQIRRETEQYGGVRDRALLDIMDKRDGRVGDDAMARSQYKEFPIQRGVITDWSALERLWHHTFYSELRVAPEDHLLLLTEPPLQPAASRERLTEMMFETFNVKGMSMCIGAVLALYSSGRTTGCVVSSGDGTTHIVPVFEGFTVPSAITHFPVAGQDITDFLRASLIERGCAPAVLTMLKDDWSRRQTEVVRDIKEKLTFVALDFDESIRQASTPEERAGIDKTYPLIDGTPLVVGTERFRCPEGLFQPRFLGEEKKDLSGIHECTFRAVSACEPKIRRQLFGNVILAGGNTAFPGLAKRLEKEIFALCRAEESGFLRFLMSGHRRLGAGCHPAVKVVSRNESLLRIIASFALLKPGAVKVVGDAQPKSSSWLGGSILSGLSSFEQMWVTSAEYNASGPSIVRRCIS